MPSNTSIVAITRFCFMHCILALLILFMMPSCGKKNDHISAPTRANGIYYWRTTFEASEAELQFLAAHNVKRLYLRLFDVDMSKRNLGDALSPQPVATIQFRDSANLAQVMQIVDECVPTIFITLPALKTMHWEASEYASKICTRILNMCSYHGFLNKVHEVQIDCDWTESTESQYFHLLDEMRYIMHGHGIQLSATIRLHQLRSAAPPVDKGVLMLYNTGSFKHPDTQNSILSYEDARPYLKKALRYNLHLDYAFPNFGWGIWFRNKTFQAILHQRDFTNDTLYEQISDTHFRVIKDHCVEKGYWLQCGDIIRKEVADMAVIEQIKQQLLFDKQTSVIMYHLDENNLKNYTNDETTTFYSYPAE